MSRSIVVVVALAAFGALAQTPAQTYTPPPMVPATPPPAPPPEPGAPPVLGTPAPPAAVPGTMTPGTPPPPAGNSPAYIPGAQNPSGYQYSPYGQPRSQEKPGPEIGLMVSESLFGALTAAGITVLPYYLLFANGVLGGDPTVSTIVFSLIFAAAPLAVAQTQVGLANGSRYYMTETWPAALAGLAGQAGVIGLFFAMGGLPHVADGRNPIGQVCDDKTGMCSGSVAFLMIGSIAVVPLIQMAIINLFKQPKYRPVASSEKPTPGALALAPPALAPVLNPSNGAVSGVNVSFLNGTW